jgi:hypothetical protein
MSERPGFRNPWQNGAKAYPEADTLEALREGMKRKRKSTIVHLSHEGFGNMPCATCGTALSAEYGDGHSDRWGTGTYYPSTKRLIVQHYYCSWQTIMNDVVKLGRYINV